jgi:hypothetical protein
MNCEASSVFVFSSAPKGALNTEHSRRHPLEACSTERSMNITEHRVWPKNRRYFLWRGASLLPPATSKKQSDSFSSRCIERSTDR